MSKVGETEAIDGVGVLTIDYPPVNALSAPTRAALDQGFRQLNDDPEVKAIVLICAGRTFIAGADIAEFGKPSQGPNLQAVFDIIENGPKPVIAAIHGAALGGGYELALICHYRIAVPSAKVGLPEVALGLLPGAGGTQRLPRIVGVPKALEIIAGGAPVPAMEALDLGMIDAIAGENSLRADAIAFARRTLASSAPVLRVRDRTDKIAPYRGRPGIYAEFLRRNARNFRGFHAPVAIVKAVEAAAEMPFDEGMARERELFQGLVNGPQSAAQRYFFFAEREAAKAPDLPRDLRAEAVGRVGVVGAGTMGASIAAAFANVGLPVTLADVSPSALEHAMAAITRICAADVAKGGLGAEELERRIARVSPTLELALLGDADLVIEAVCKDVALTKGVFKQIDAVAKPQAILASSTSCLDIDGIAASTSRPERVLGLQFFQPAHVMRLLEIVRGRSTAPATLAAGLAVARTLAKAPVISRAAPGLIANRVMGPRGEAAIQLALEGESVEDIDQAMFDFGFPMGPFKLMDFLGLDVMGEGRAVRAVQSELVKLGRLGRKQAAGFYDYNPQSGACLSPVAVKAIADVAAAQGVKRKKRRGPTELLERLLFPVVNEAAATLEDGVAIRPSDIDVACVLGYRWPVYTGGPMFWADMLGLARVVDAMRAMGLTPGRLILEKAAKGERLTQR